MTFEELMQEVRFDANGLVPAIAQDARTGEVLMLAYMNAESLRKTRETGLATYFSRSRQKLWQKGETSGHIQEVVDIRLDCDGDTILLKVLQTGNACHTGAHSCFFRDLPLCDEDEMPVGSGILEDVYRVIADRAAHPKEGSYTNYLLNKGVEKICKKVGEEASEAIIAAMKGNCEEMTYEAADLMYHLLVLLYQQGVSPQDVFDELGRRR
ncbi:MAG: bifunctional phosphoribosyl-AMP cyclohydrolase/phosphoribosyl-ATP diphosphatase HisIE [Clostridia bacterium]|nr:bifunctional phosphoribosyl-AMP cyclohydrolase/phosphoribosyl-ATP diphosphatase HisIE [Clostridia bacterium]